MKSLILVGFLISVLATFSVPAVGDTAYLCGDSTWASVGDGVRLICDYSAQIPVCTQAERQLCQGDDCLLYDPLKFEVLPAAGGPPPYDIYYFDASYVFWICQGTGPHEQEDCIDHPGCPAADPPKCRCNELFEIVGKTVYEETTHACYEVELAE